MSDVDVPADPFPWLTEWLPANDNPARPLMAIATVTAEGLPDTRNALLSEFDADGFYFHTDSRSRKVAQLAANPGVALAMFFPEHRRQLTVQGLAEVASAEEIRRAYEARPPYLQQLAWQNTDEFATLPLEDRISSWSAFAATHAEGFTPPPTWTGYLVRPLRVSFWIGHPETASRRVEFTRATITDTHWEVRHIAG